jgi:ABC-type branched-subunit amino acid transport system ATPase component
VAAHADSLVVLQKGQVVVEGSAATLRNSPDLGRYLGV